MLGRIFVAAAFSVAMAGCASLSPQVSEPAKTPLVLRWAIL